MKKENRGGSNSFHRRVLQRSRITFHADLLSMSAGNQTKIPGGRTRMAVNRKLQSIREMKHRNRLSKEAEGWRH